MSASLRLALAVAIVAVPYRGWAQQAPPLVAPEPPPPTYPAPTYPAPAPQPTYPAPPPPAIAPPVYAPGQVPPGPVPMAPPPPASESPTHLYLNAGPLYFVTSTRFASHPRFGLSLGLTVSHEVADGFGFSFDYNLGLTEWDRAAATIDWGNRAFSWTAGAYGSVTSWVSDGPKDQQFLRGFGALFAYLGLSLGFLVGASAYLAAPIAAINETDFDFTFAYSMTHDPRLFVEGGLGGIFYGHPEGGAVLGFQPVVAMGVAFSKFQIRIRGAWSPPALQTEAPNPTQAFSLAATIGFVP